MKKIMFNDKYGLTQSVLAGRKTMTRRAITNKHCICCLEARVTNNFIIKHFSRYKVGEVVAIAQSYKDIANEISEKYGDGHITNSKDFVKWCGCVIRTNEKAYTNKMFVKADLMPHHIRITNVRVERLQDISDEDCFREGIRREKFGDSMHYYFERNKGFYSPKDAFSVLIDKVSKKSTWDINPYVFVYEFEKVD